MHNGRVREDVMCRKTIALIKANIRSNALLLITVIQNIRYISQGKIKYEAHGDLTIQHQLLFIILRTTIKEYTF